MNSADAGSPSEAVPDTLADTIVASPSDTRPPIVRHSQFPNTIGRYRIVQVLGEGGMGTVYQAEKQHPRRRVALKIIKPGATNTNTLRRFEQESEVLGRLHHPQHRSDLLRLHR